MATEKRLIDAMKTVTKMSGRITPLIQMGANPIQIYNEVLQVIAEAPTVDAVEVVHGRWIEENEASIRCSKCCFNRASIKIPMDYCPNCGANMQEREEQ